ncbi:MAG: endonuclease/exonuclease/phosphatase family protein [Phycisphaerales bacterium]
MASSPEPPAPGWLLTGSRVAFALLALALCVATLLPIIETNQWWVRIFDFPRIQITVLIAITLAAQTTIGLLAWRWRRRAGLPGSRASRLGRVVLPALLFAALCWQLFRIAPYTPILAVQMQDARAEPGERIRLLIHNVRYDNRRSDALLELVERVDPDAVLLAEPTQWWHEAVQPLAEAYPHTVEQPQENHYGLLFYSRFELVEPDVRFLVEDEVPSIRTGVRLPSGRVVRLYGLHPKPPGLKRPVDPEREDSDQRDAELLTVAKEIKEAHDSGDDTPTIVAGDFNDVAWSHTTRLFQRVSGLLDPRIGRGLFNSFSARSRIQRYPIDHVFASEHFRLVRMEVLADIGSDHHPIVVTLALQPTAEATQDEPDPEGDDLEEAEETIEEAKEKVQEEPGS